MHLHQENIPPVFPTDVNLRSKLSDPSETTWCSPCNLSVNIDYLLGVRHSLPSGAHNSLGSVWAQKSSSGVLSGGVLFGRTAVLNQKFLLISLFGICFMSSSNSITQNHHCTHLILSSLWPRSQLTFLSPSRWAMRLFSAAVFGV